MGAIIKYKTKFIVVLLLFRKQIEPVNFEMSEGLYYSLLLEKELQEMASTYIRKFLSGISGSRKMILYKIKNNYNSQELK